MKAGSICPPILTQPIPDLTDQLRHSLGIDTTSPSQAYSSARVKLRTRHLLEWNTLAANQQKVLELIREESAPKFSALGDNILACVDLRNKQTARLYNLMVSQQHERDQLQLRHQQEEAFLKQVSKPSDKS